jgi:hypothetical protein
MLSLVRSVSSSSLNGQYLVAIGDARPDYAAILDEIESIFKGEREREGVKGEFNRFSQSKVQSSMSHVSCAGQLAIFGRSRPWRSSLSVRTIFLTLDYCK